MVFYLSVFYLVYKIKETFKRAKIVDSSFPSRFFFGVVLFFVLLFGVFFVSAKKKITDFNRI